MADEDDDADEKYLERLRAAEQQKGVGIALAQMARARTDLGKILPSFSASGQIDAAMAETENRARQKALLFIWHVRHGNVFIAKNLFDAGGFDINTRDEHGMTALHYAAAMGSRPCIRLLVNRGQCDYLIKDNKDRYASELAFEYAHDYAVGVLLSKKQAKAAANSGKA